MIGPLLYEYEAGAVQDRDNKSVRIIAIYTQSEAESNKLNSTHQHTTLQKYSNLVM